MIGIKFDVPQSRASNSLYVNTFAESALKEILNAVEEAVQVERLWIQRLSPRKGEKSTSERCSSLCRSLGIRYRYVDGQRTQQRYSFYSVFQIAKSQMLFSFKLP